MNANYKEELNKLVDKKKKEIPTVYSEEAVRNIFTIIESTPDALNKAAENFNDKTSLLPIIESKRSFRETLIHFLNIEGLNYTTIYPAFLLNKPKIHPIHAERDFARLQLYNDFNLKELLEAFGIERKKTINFLKTLKNSDWLKQMSEEKKSREETIYWRARGLAIHDYTHQKILNFQIRGAGLQ